MPCSLILRIPRCLAHVGREGRPSAPEPPSQAALPRLLLVDPDPDSSDLLARRLRRRGFDVDTASDGAEGLEAFGATKYDVVILEVLLPDISGLELLATIRASYSPAALPVIVATGRQRSEDVVATLSQGANDYVSKPLEFELVLARVQNQLTIKRAFDQSVADSSSIQVIAPGTVLQDRYELGRLLGKGGFARVHEARQLSTGQRVAIKILDSDEDPLTLRRFTREMEAIRLLRHESIVRLIDSGDVRTGLAVRRPFIVMEYIEGETLQRRLERSGPFGVEAACSLLLPLASALSTAHRKGVIHRDVKPANVILTTRTSSDLHPVLLDFGISKLSSTSQLTTTGTFLGTPRHIAPEQARGASGDARVDQYGLGLMLFHCLIGRSPFADDMDLLQLIHMIATGQIPRLSRELPEIPSRLEEIVHRALASDPDDRFPSTAQLGVELLPFATETARQRWRAALERDLSVPPAVRDA